MSASIEFTGRQTANIVFERLPSEQKIEVDKVEKVW